jgi:hypothetical protein
MVRRGFLVPVIEVRILAPQLLARVEQVVSSADCKSVAYGCVGSIPTPSTNKRETMKGEQ